MARIRDDLRLPSPTPRGRVVIGDQSVCTGGKVDAAVNDGRDDVEFETDHDAGPSAPKPASDVPKANSRLRSLILAALALAVCRIVSNWLPQAAMIAAALILAFLPVRFVWMRPRLARCVFYLVLPAVLGADALAVALSATMALVWFGLGALDGETAEFVAHLATVVCLAAAGSINLCALARPSFDRRRWISGSVAV